MYERDSVYLVRSPINGKPRYEIRTCDLAEARDRRSLRSQLFLQPRASTLDLSPCFCLSAFAAGAFAAVGTRIEVAKLVG